MIVIQSVLIMRRRIADDSSNWSHMIGDGLRHRIRMTFASAGRRNKLRVDGFTGARLLWKLNILSHNWDICSFPSNIYFWQKSFAKNRRAKKMLFLLQNIFFAVRFFQISFKRTRKKNNFIISAATCVRCQCETKKCSERFQGFLNMKKIVFKYMYCNILLCCCECEPSSRDSHQHGRRVAGALLLALFLRHPANVFFFALQRKNTLANLNSSFVCMIASNTATQMDPKIREILKL